MRLQGELERDAALWLLGSLCGLFRIPFDASLIAQSNPPPFTFLTLHEAARALGIRTGHHPLAGIDWQKLPFPLIAFASPETPAGLESEAPAASHPSLNPLLIVKASSDQLLFFRPGQQTPETLPIADASTRLAPELLLVARDRTAGGGEADDIAGFTTEKKAFGFSWFIPELLKHKTLWRDVQLASLATQLVGLSTPLGPATDNNRCRADRPPGSKVLGKRCRQGEGDPARRIGRSSGLPIV